MHARPPPAAPAQLLSALADVVLEEMGGSSGVVSGNGNGSGDGGTHLAVFPGWD